MDAVTKLLKPHGQLMVLIKPQFEAARHEVGKGGIIKNTLIHEKVIAKVIAGIQEHGFTLQGVIESPIAGTQGNKEFLAYFKRN
jgi:23S rRNA (cytidine1920-2'-O)/16S rRNA (cytidine1409-2'-O)-methyltransferase